MKTFLPHLISEMFNRIEFWGVRWQGQQLDVRWGHEFFTGVPTGAIHHHHDEVIGMPCCHGVQEYLHALRVDLGQDQGIHRSGGWLARCVGIGVLVAEHGLA